MSDVSPGQRFGPYRIETELGRGGMSIVYRAVEDSLSRTIALKIMASHLHDDTSYRQRFHVEARAAAAINHPNIVPIYAFGEQDARLYIAMQFVEGTDLRRHLQTYGRLDPPAATRIIEQVAYALDAIHARGMTHRDIKPDNILLGAPGRDGTPHVYVSDFGLTRGEGDAHLTSTGQILGTMTYAAPEQLLAEPVDGRADVYALACVLFETVVGRPPFDREVAAALIYAHVHEPPPSASSRRPDLPTAMDAVLLKGMAKARDDRYRTAGELIDAFRLAAEAWVPSGAVDAGAGTVDIPQPAGLAAPGSFPPPPGAPGSPPPTHLLPDGTPPPQPVPEPPGAPSLPLPPGGAEPEQKKRKKRGCTVTISVGLAVVFVTLLGGGLATVIGGGGRGNETANAPTSTAVRSTTTADADITVRSTVLRSTTTRSPTTTDRSGGNGELEPVLRQMNTVLEESAKSRKQSNDAVQGVLDSCKVTPADASRALGESITSRMAQLAELKKVDTAAAPEAASLVTSLTTVLNQAVTADQAYQRWLDTAIATNPDASPPGCPNGSVPKDLDYTQAAAAASGSATIRQAFVTLYNAQASKFGLPTVSADSI